MRPAEPGGALCPIHAGAAMADLLRPGEDLTMHGILEPIWLLPFVYRRAGRRHSAALTWVDGGIVVDAAPPEVGAAAPRLLVDRLDWITFELSAPRSPERTGGRIDTSFDGTPIDPSAHAKLEAWAARTYVAASFQSRLAGAGAGLSDND